MGTFTCDICGFVGKYKCLLARHLCSVHFGDKPGKQKKNPYRCVCGLECFKRHDMISHYISAHEVTLNCETLEFTEDSKFLEWKQNVEDQTRVRFIRVRSSTKNKNGTTYCKYPCHREGFYVPSGQNRRRQKTNGSNKMGTCCPAEINTLVNDSGIIQVTYISSHFGHDFQEARVKLSNREREYLAEKLAQNISMDEIIASVRRKDNEEGFKRIHLTTKKDLFNIARDFKISRPTREKHVRQKCSENPLRQKGTTPKAPRTKLTAVEKRHDSALKMNDSLLQRYGVGWNLTDVSGGEIVQIYENNWKCMCSETCIDCNCCIHSYKCTCPDSSKKGNMCKHIHFLVLKLSQMQEPNSAACFVMDQMDDSLVIDEVPQKDDDDTFIITDLLRLKKDETNMEERIRALRAQMDEIIGLVKTPDDAALLEKLMAPILPAMKSGYSDQQVAGYLERDNPKIKVQKAWYASTDKNVNTQQWTIGTSMLLCDYEEEVVSTSNIMQL